MSLVLSALLAAMLGAPSAGLATEPADTPAVRLDAAGLKARLAAAQGDTPPDLSGVDLSGLDLRGTDFRRTYSDWVFFL